MSRIRQILGILSFAALIAARPADLRKEIEQDLRALIGEQLPAGKFFVSVAVEMPDGAAPAKPPPSAKDGAKLPYAAVRVPASTLQSLLDGATPTGPAVDDSDAKVTITIGLDKDLPQARSELIQRLVKERYSVDDNKRFLKVESVDLSLPAAVTAPPPQPPQPSPVAQGGEEALRLERASLESERARMRLENERSKLELERKELELTKSRPDPATASGSGSASASASAEKPAPVVEVQASNPVKDFQMTFLAVILGVLLLVGAVLAGGSFVKGMKPLSEALATVGSSIEAVAKSGASAGGASAAPAAASAPTQAAAAQNDDHGGMAHAAPAPHTSPELEAFAEMVQEKVEVLSKEKNFNFFRVLAEMIDGRDTLPRAAAILLALKGDAAKAVVKVLSVDQIARLRSFLASDGGMLKAKEQRTSALADFYGRVAMDEFTDSPFMILKDATWLTSMSTRDMAQLTLSLSDADRPVFLACLSPERTRLVLGTLTSDDDKRKIMKAVADIQGVAEERVLPFLEDLSTRMNSGNKGAAKPKKAVDAARYVARIASELVESEQRVLFDFLKNDKELLVNMREFYIPFNVLTGLPKELINEIFGEMPEARIATTIYDSSQEVRDKVIGALPDIRAESVRAELKTLEGDTFYDKRTRNTSASLQREICKYLQKLYAEGLLKLDESAPIAAVAGGANANAA